jgi:pimeloyl-ACP methyl ester carboxylesterase
VGETTPVTPLTITATGKALPVPPAAAALLLSPNPMTLLGDDDDRLDPLGYDRMLAPTIPGAVLVTYPDAGHALLLQDEAAIAARLLAFLHAT